MLGLRRSKPLFFRWEGAFLIQNSSTKDFQWALPHPHLTWGHSSAFQAYQWHVPIRAPIKSAPFPWNISKHFDGSGFPPAGFLESLSPHLFFPPSFPPLPPSPLPIPPLFWVNLRSSTSPVTGSGHGNSEQDEGRAAEEGETCPKPFSLEEPVLLMGRGCIAGCWRRLTWIPQVSLFSFFC